jgi:hypothetical protein
MRVEVSDDCLMMLVCKENGSGSAAIEM